jgi:hypothetical protein
MARYHVILREIRQVVVAVELDGRLGRSKAIDAAIDKVRAGEGTELSNETGELHFHEVDGPVPEGFNPRFGYDSYHERDPADYEEGEEFDLYGASFDLIYWCRPLFDDCVHDEVTQMMNHNQVKKILVKAGVIKKQDGCDSESGAIYFNWKTEQDAKDFIDRLNEWVEKELALLTSPAA